jgi:hypothetical protein
MISTKATPEWEDTGTSRQILRKFSQPVAIYDLRVKRSSTFFTFFGKVSLACLCCLIVYGIWGWSTGGHRKAAALVDLGQSDTPRTSDLTFAQPEMIQAAQPQTPDVSYVITWGLTANAAAISWSTNVPATTLLRYGSTASLGQSMTVKGKLDVTHGVELEGLRAATTYYYVAQSADKNGVIGTSMVRSFITLAEPKGPSISDIVVVPGKNNQVEILWSTSVPAYSFVQIGSTTTYNRWSTRTVLTTSPHPSIAWVPSGVVHYQLVSVDAKGNKTSSPDYTFSEQ